MPSAAVIEIVIELWLPVRPKLTKRRLMMPLTDEQIAVAQKAINGRTDGIYTAREILGESLWGKLGDPNGYGGLFKDAVIRKKLGHIRLLERNGKNHQTYQISK